MKPVEQSERSYVRLSGSPAVHWQGGGGALTLLSWSTVEPVTVPPSFIGYRVLTNYGIHNLKLFSAI
jgi:hypothetical protein